MERTSGCFVKTCHDV